MPDCYHCFCNNWGGRDQTFCTYCLWMPKWEDVKSLLFSGKACADPYLVKNMIQYKIMTEEESKHITIMDAIKRPPELIQKGDHYLA